MIILNERSGDDGSTKFLVGMGDGSSVETLYMQDREMRLTYHATACVSSQVGCAVGCRFCATGAQGFVRNLDEEEIAGQVRLIDAYRRRTDSLPLEAVVFAGMGEPLFNYDNVTRAVDSIGNLFGLHDFELATAGVAPKLRSLADFVKARGIRLRLNVSLHATTDEKRTRLIPLTKTYGISAILGAAADFAEATGTKARVRYMLLKDFNDSEEDMARLSVLLRGKPLKLIISQYNDNNINGLVPPNPLDVLEFYNKIREDVDCDIFHNFGGGVLGGCGQLRQSCRHGQANLPGDKKIS